MFWGAKCWILVDCTWSLLYKHFKTQNCLKPIFGNKQCDKIKRIPLYITYYIEWECHTKSTQYIQYWSTLFLHILVKNIIVTVTGPPLSTELMHWMQCISCTKEYSGLSISLVLNSSYHLTIRFTNRKFRIVRYIEIDYNAQCIKSFPKMCEMHCFPLIQLPYLDNIQFSYACFEVHILLVLLYNEYKFWVLVDKWKYVWELIVLIFKILVKMSIYVLKYILE